MKGLQLVCLVVLMYLLKSSTSFLQQKVPRLSEAEWNTYYDREENGPGTYSFGYDIDDAKSGNAQFRQEERYPNGTIEGSYGLTDPDGNVRVVYYTADHLGYRARIQNSIHKNEDYPPRVVHQAQVSSWILQKQNSKSQQFWKMSSPEFVLNSIEQSPSLVPLLSYYKGTFYLLYVNGPISRWILSNKYYPKENHYQGSL